MKILTINNWSVGMDVRKPSYVSSANRLVTLKNAYVNTGKTITKRSGTEKLGTFTTTTHGMFSYNNKINVFSEFAQPSSYPNELLFNNNELQWNQLTHPAYSAASIVGINHVDTVGGYIFVSAKWNTIGAGSSTLTIYGDNGLAGACSAVCAAYATNTTPENQTLYNYLTTTVSGFKIGDIDHVADDNGVYDIRISDAVDFTRFSLYMSNTVAIDARIQVIIDYAETVLQAGSTHEDYAAFSPYSAVLEDQFHYLDGGSGSFTSLCPHSDIFTVAAGKVYAKDGDIVRFCEVNDPREWDTINNAGFIATGNYSDAKTDVTALHTYRGALLVMHGNVTQEWSVDPDPELSSLKHTLYIGAQNNKSVANVSGDVYFLADGGFRSIAVQNTIDSLIDFDVGSPVDSAIVDDANISSLYNNYDGQYWCVVGDIVWIYTFSKTAKLSAWSYYEYNFTIDEMTMHKNDVIFRSGNNIYRTNKNVFTDDTQNYEVIAQFSDLDFKANTALKQIHGFDLAQVGDCTAEFKVGTENKTTTHSVDVSGDFRDAGMVSLPLIATHVSPKFTNNNTTDWSLHLVNIVFDPMGVL